MLGLESMADACWTPLARISGSPPKTAQKSTRINRSPKACIGPRSRCRHDRVPPASVLDPGKLFPLLRGLSLSFIELKVQYGAVVGAISRLSKRLAKGKLRTEMKRILYQLSNSLI